MTDKQIAVIKKLLNISIPVNIQFCFGHYYERNNPDSYEYYLACDMAIVFRGEYEACKICKKISNSHDRQRNKHN